MNSKLSPILIGVTSVVTLFITTGCSSQNQAALDAVPPVSANADAPPVNPDKKTFGAMGVGGTTIPVNYSNANAGQATASASAGASTTQSISTSSDSGSTVSVVSAGPSGSVQTVSTTVSSAKPSAHTDGVFTAKNAAQKN